MGQLIIGKKLIVLDNSEKSREVNSKLKSLSHLIKTGFLQAHYSPAEVKDLRKEIGFVL